MVSQYAPTEQQIDSFQSSLAFAEAHPTAINWLSKDRSSATLALTAINIFAPSDSTPKNYLGIAVFGALFFMLGAGIMWFLRRKK